MINPTHCQTSCLEVTQRARVLKVKPNQTLPHHRSIIQLCNSALEVKGQGQMLLKSNHFRVSL